jgi:N-acetylmuramoyl-L-alanine amidase
VTYTLSSPLIAKSATTYGVARDWAEAHGAKRIDEVKTYLDCLSELCLSVGFDYGLMVAQSAHETDNWTSHWWEARLNPAGLGITGDDAENDASLTFKNGCDAARAQAAHMIAYVFTKQSDWVDGWLSVTQTADLSPGFYDKRFSAVGAAGLRGTVKVIGELGTGKWATDPNYAAQIVAKANQIFGGTAPVTELRVILNPGHRNDDGGNPEEAAFTPKLANAYFDAFMAAGFETVNLGDTDGGLDAACRRMAAQIASAPGQCVLFDLHLEGTDPGGPTGAFSIVPDVTGLHTNAPVAQDPGDTWANNTKDRELGARIVQNMTLATGLKPRTSGVRETGLMDESETGVGGDGWRLATFAYTSPHRMKAVRLVIEHGNHTNQPDRTIIFTPGFAEKCAAAAVSAVKAVYGGASPQPPVQVQPSPIWWEPGDVGPVKRESDGAVALAMLGEVTAKRTVPLRKDADAKAPKVGEVQLHTLSTYTNDQLDRIINSEEGYE